MSHEKLKMLKIGKSEFETFEKSPDPTTSYNFPNLKLFFSLNWEHFSLSWFHHPHDPESHLKLPKNCLTWEKKTINPKLQPTCFSLVHIKVQWKRAFHLKNVRLKDGFKRRICDCEFPTTDVLKGKARIQNIGFMNKISLYVVESHFALTLNQNMKVNNFHLLFFNSFIWNGAHQRF